MYIGVKEFINGYHEPFDRIAKATNKAKKDLKDRGERATKEMLNKEIELVIAEWDEKIEKGYKAHEFVYKKEIEKNPNIIVGKYKKAESLGSELLNALEINKLELDKTYLEKQIVSNHNGLIGYIDKLEVTKNGFINITDIKSWEHIYRSSSFVVNGFRVPPKFFFSPIDNLQDCNYNEVCLQLSIYMYIVWTYNKKLKPGKLCINHLILNEDGKVIDEKIIEVPYLRREVKALLNNKKKMNG